eukprot:evm.model.NODE_4650_length_26121_cov_23.177099.5
MASLTAPSGPAGPAPSVFYDAFSTRIYDPKGRVLQLEYALEATKKGGAAVGAVGGDLAVLASWTPRTSRRQAPAAQQAALGLWRGDAHVALAGTGLATDVLALVEVARRECLAHRYVHEFPLRVGRLVTLLAQDVYDTERHRIVPYALDLLVVGYDRQGGPCLFKVGPAGVIESFRACAVGRRAEQARAYLLARLGEPHATESGAGHPGLRRLTTTVLRALLSTIVEEEGRGLEGRVRDEEQQRVEEDISMVVLGKEIPYTPLIVAWDPYRRRMEVRIPAALAAILEDQERRSTDQADGSTPPR